MNDNNSENLQLPNQTGVKEESNSCDKSTTTFEGKNFITSETQDIPKDTASNASNNHNDIPSLPLQSHDSEYHLTSENPLETDSTKSAVNVNISYVTSETNIETVPCNVIPSTSDSQPDLLYHTPRSSKISSTDSEESLMTFNASKLRKKRPKSDSIISKIIIDKSKKNGLMRSKHSSPSGRANKDKSNSQNNCNSWRILDICDRIVLKGCRSLAKLYTGIPTEPPSHHLERYNQKIQDTQEIRNVLVELLKVQSKQAEENQQLRDDVRKVMSKLDQLEDKLRAGQTSYSGHCPPPPPPPPPPPLPGDFHTRHRVRSAPTKKSSPCLPTFTITPQDIASVKLKKTKTKSASK